MTNYQRGYVLEQKVKKFFENQGYFVIRSAGSHSPVDLVVIPTDKNFGKRLQFIQCKKTSLESIKVKGLHELRELAKSCDATPELAYSFRSKTGKGYGIKIIDNDIMEIS